MAEICLKALRKNYGHTEVLHGINLQIADGEFVVIVGPSGCGKSTLLRMVAGLETVTDGEIHIGNRLVNQLEPAARDIAMVFQNYALYPHMSVRQNMSYGLRIRGVPKAQIAARVSQVAATLELASLLDRRPRELSGGQRQRVAMGRAIIREPAVFLFDEPLSNLDAKLRVQMRIELELLHRRLRTTSLYVTHDQVEAMTLADRMVVLNAGRVEQIGTPGEVYARPASIFVAGFIGQPPMNLIGMHRTGSSLHLPDDGENSVRLNLPDDHLPETFVLGFRPEHLQLTTEGNANLVAQISVIEYLGSDMHAYCRLGGQQIVVRLAENRRLRPGEWIFLATEPSRLHFFSVDSGKRISLPPEAAGDCLNEKDTLHLGEVAA